LKIEQGAQAPEEDPELGRAAGSLWDLKVRLSNPNYGNQLN